MNQSIISQNRFTISRYNKTIKSNKINIIADIFYSHRHYILKDVKKIGILISQIMIHIVTVKEAKIKTKYFKIALFGFHHSPYKCYMPSLQTTRHIKQSIAQNSNIYLSKRRQNIIIPSFQLCSTTQSFTIKISQTKL